ncbi:MAG: dihydroorotate dehydrogenase electron transfer subunit [Bacteroidales bacterium]|nr:dihydroorotate dehydrogenase electron transfer subunit [Bacteroidales bacterium]
MKKVQAKAKVVEKYNLNAHYYVIKVKILNLEKFPTIQPGQFAQIRLDYSVNNSILPRPFTIMDYNEQDQTLRFLIKRVGKLTTYLQNVNVNETINVLFPLGNGFTLSNNSLVLAGGSGVASIILLLKNIISKNFDFDVLVGSKDITLVTFFKKEFPEINAYFSTEDGSAGEKGVITEHSLIKSINKYSKVYACGPEVMMKKIVSLCTLHNVDCEVSLENTMACGFGVCLCCVVKTIYGNLCTCTEGPVFNSKHLIW